MKEKILHSQIIGEGKPFLILHGFMGMGDNWRTLGLQWSEIGYEVHLVDLRNHGRSFHSEEFSYENMAQDVKAYIDAHGLNEIILLGHSMGGKVAMEFAMLFPQKVSKLIIADISPKAYPPHHQSILKALSQLDFDKIKSRSEAEEVLSEYIKDESTRLFLLKNLYRTSGKKYALRLNLPVLTSKIEEVGMALSPNTVYSGDTLFLSGEKSGYIEAMDEILIKKHFPNAIIKMVPNAGHWLHAENPEEFFSLSNSFLESE